MSDNLPMEIQMEIVKRFPVKSLFQFRSVSKSWKSLIDSPQFIAYYNACDSRPHNLLISYKDDAYADPKFDYIVDDDIFPQNKVATAFPMASSFELLNELKLIGSSQGLICILAEYKNLNDDTYWEKVFIWNPAIRKSITVDVPLLYTIPMYATLLGFGVCPDTNEPMLVKHNYYTEIYLPVQVFTLSSKVWRWPRSNLPRKSVSFTRYQVAIDGFIYWITYNGLIVSFNMTTEDFVEINLPPRLAKANAFYLSLYNLSESLAVLEPCTEAEKPVFAVWMMERGVSKSFTKLFTVTTPNACLRKVLGFRKNGEVILEAKIDEDYEPDLSFQVHEPAVLEGYEPHSKVIKDLGIYREHGLFFVSSYKETLLLLDQGNNQHIESEVEW